MSIKLFPLIEDITLTEYAANSALEAYKAIVIEPTHNEFKVVSGMYSDKKDCYTQLTERGFICRKVFEKRVFDWIEENAENNLDAYLMFSTAVSKWQGNNMLSKYYEKILHDIPVMNREKQKGNPNSRKTEESTLEEDSFDWKSRLIASSDKARAKIQSSEQAKAQHAEEYAALKAYLAEKKLLDKMALDLPKDEGFAELEYKYNKFLKNDKKYTSVVKKNISDETKDKIKKIILSEVNKRDNTLLNDTKKYVEDNK